MTTSDKPLKEVGIVPISVFYLLIENRNKNSEKSGSFYKIFAFVILGVLSVFVVNRVFLVFL